MINLYFLLPDEDIDWDSVSEDDIFVDYPEDVDQERKNIVFI